MKGQARSSDVVSIMHDCEKVLQRMTRLEAAMEELRMRVVTI